MQITFFSLEASKYFPYIELGKIYSFSGAKLKESGRFNWTNNNIEMSVLSKTKIEWIKEDDNSIP